MFFFPELFVLGGGGGGGGGVHLILKLLKKNKKIIINSHYGKIEDVIWRKQINKKDTLRFYPIDDDNDGT